MNSGRRPPVVDSAVPALGLILDVNRLRAWLKSHDEVLVRRPYLRYKPGTSCVAAVELQSGRALLYGVDQPGRPKLEKLIARAPKTSVRVVDHDYRLVLAGMEADRDLPAVKDLSRAVAHLHLERAAELEVLVHKPQRRLVGLLPGERHGSHRSDDDGVVVLRAYRRQRLAHAVASHLTASRVEGVRTAEVLRSSTRYALLALDYLPGLPLDEMLAAGTAAPAILRATGLALARLHAAPVPAGPQQEAAIVQAAGLIGVSAEARETAGLVTRLCPAFKDRMSWALEELNASRPPPNEAVFRHGDFSPGQVIVDREGRPGLIDWDRAGMGDPAGDLASLRAAGLTEDQFDTVLEGYRALRPPPGHMGWHLAHARLMQAADPFRTGTPGWLTKVEANLGAVETALQVREQWS